MTGFIQLMIVVFISIIFSLLFLSVLAGSIVGDFLSPKEKRKMNIADN